jgi:sugar phosphate isomerase/epimerase
MAALAAANQLAGQSQAAHFGIASTCFLSYRRPQDALEFLDYGRTLGAAGIQIPLRSREPAYLRTLRERCERYGMWFEAMVPMPMDPATDLPAAIAAARDAGAVACRTACLSGRRYETFRTAESWREFVARSEQAMESASRIAERERMYVGMENHKDWTNEELSSFMSRFGNEYFGLCLDTGNNVALLDDPDTLVKSMARYTVSTHIKDMAWTFTDEAMFLSEVNLGQGYLPVSTYVTQIRAARPKTRFTLEMITRDPLRVPCWDAEYYLTLPTRNARILAQLKQAAKAKSPSVPRTGSLPRAEQLRQEEDNVRQCLRWQPT